MPLVPAKCPSCSASLTLDDASVGKSVTCPYCNSTLILEKQPDNTFVTNVEHADTVIVQDSKSIENRLANAETFLSAHRNYAKAGKLFDELINDASGEWRAWWGFVRAKTEEFTNAEMSYNDFVGLEGRAHGAFNVAPAEMRSQLEATWEGFVARYRAYQGGLANKIADLKGQIRRLEQSEQTADAERQRLEQQLQGLKEQWKKADQSAKRNETVGALPIANPVTGCLAALLAVSFLARLFTNVGELIVNLPALFVIIVPFVLWFLFFKKRSDSRASERSALEANIADVQRRIASENATVASSQKGVRALSDQLRELNDRLGEF